MNRPAQATANALAHPAGSPPSPSSLSLSLSPSLSLSLSLSFSPLAVAVLVFCHADPAVAQTALRVAQLPPVEVISVGPLPDLNVPKDQVPANMQTATGAELDRRHTLDGVRLNQPFGDVVSWDLILRAASPRSR